MNVRAGFFLAQQLVPGMIEVGSGAVCNVTSIHGFAGAPEHAVYAGTKGAIIAYTRTLAVELAHKGVRVNAIAPGCVPVENYAQADAGYNEEAAKKWAANAIPLGRYGYPVEVARLAVYLCSEVSSFIVGQTITIDGGTTAMMSLVTDFRNESNARLANATCSRARRRRPEHPGGIPPDARSGHPVGKGLRSAKPRWCQ